MRTVKGAAEINSWGGYEKQYQIRIDPERLIKHDLTFDEVDRGGRQEQPQRRRRQHQPGRRACCSCRAWAAPPTIEQIRQIVVTAKDGVPIRVADVAEVSIGHEIRRGAVTADGKGEVVLGLGFMLMGENSHEVTWAMKDKLEAIKATLPANVQVEPVYDRTELVDHVIDTVRQEPVRRRACWSSPCCSLFLGNLRAAPDRRPGDSAVDAVRVLRHVAIRHRRQPAQPGGHRLRHDRR